MKRRIYEVPATALAYFMITDSVFHISEGIPNASTIVDIELVHVPEFLNYAVRLHIEHDEFEDVEEPSIHYPSFRAIDKERLALVDWMMEIGLDEKECSQCLEDYTNCECTNCECEL